MEGWTYTATEREPCKHANGWYHTVRFWLFKRRYFACFECKKLVPVTGWHFRW